MVSLFSGLIARARSITRGVRRTADVDAEMDEEFRHHLELRSADLVRSGLAPAAAARQARLEFGSFERFKDKGRASRGLRRFDDLRASWLDFKLGFRMLIKYPGLTIVGGLAMAFAIAVGAGTFELATEAIGSTLPVPDGDRIVGIQNRDLVASRTERRASHDLMLWREALRSVRELGAYRDVERNLIVGNGPGEPVRVAEINASAFRVTRVPPLLGRVLVEAAVRGRFGRRGPHRTSR
jgi:putative ABC transport system permease protein